MKQLNFILLILCLGLTSKNLIGQTLTNQPQTICQGETRPYRVDWQVLPDDVNGTPGSTYVWSVLPLCPAVIIPNQSPGGFNNHILINWGATPPGLYQVQVIETSNGCPSAPVTLDVQILATPTANAGAPQTICQDGTTAALSGTVGGSATGGTWSSNVGGTFSPNANTLNATWTPPAGFNGIATLTLTTTGMAPCAAATSTVDITATPINTIALSSAVGTDAQTICINTPIVNITYTVTGATGATITNLPTGVTGSYAGGVVTISGTPTGSGTFNYNITLTGGCGTVTETGSINVTPDNTINLTSAAGTNAQSICINTSLVDIAYAVTGATGATVSGLPTGVTGNFAGGVVTITGTPIVSGTFNYTVALTGGCGTVTANGSITVTPSSSITLSSAVGTDAQTICINTPILDITYTVSGATGATITGLPAGVTGSYAGGLVTITGTPTVSGNLTYTITPTGGCGVVSANGDINVNPIPVTSPIFHD
jgi:hypothetical protein